MNPSNTVVVISVYKKLIPWADRLREMGFEVRAYTKEDPTSVYNVPKNVGCEATAYLKYIIDNYDTLSDYSILLHDHESSWHQEGSIVDAIREKLGTEETFHNFNITTKAAFYLYDVGAYISFYNKYLKKYIGTEIYSFGEFVLNRKLNAQFLIHKKHIQFRPLELYTNLYNWFMNDKRDKWLSAYVLEVFWDIIFGQVSEITYFPKIAVCTNSINPRDDFLIQYGENVFDFYTTNPSTNSKIWKYINDSSIDEINTKYNFQIFINYDNIDVEFYDYILSMLYVYNLIKSNIFLTLSGDPEGHIFYIKSLNTKERLYKLVINDPDLSNSGFLGTHAKNNPERFKRLAF